MLKEIIFEKSKGNILDNEISLKFNEGVNIIIGPKGGGKSTLFDLVSSLPEKYIPNTVIDALAAYGLKFQRAIYSNGEELLNTQIDKKVRKEKEIDFTRRYDVIFQDDPIKKDINNLGEIQKFKNKYLKDLVSKSDAVKEVIDEIHDFYSNMHKIFILKDQKNINWTNTFKFVNNKSDQYKLITNLNFRTENINAKIRKELDYITSILNDIEEQENNYNTYLTFKFDEVFLDDKFNDLYKTNISNMIDSFKSLKEILNKRKRLLNKINLMHINFKAGYIKISDKIKKEDFTGNGLRFYEKAAKDFFQDLAKTIIVQKQKFNTLINNNIVLNFNDKGLSDGMLVHKINDQVEFSQDVIFDLLKVVLPAPGNAITSVYKWISSLFKNDFKEFDMNKLYNNFVKQLEPYVSIYADDMDYTTMSLGQRSIFGIKYKYNRSFNKDLFLDQPEDNLDNYTIAHDLIQMINKKPKGTQVFIVTHNANIGLLTHAKQIIVANLNDTKGKQYQYGTLTTKNSPTKNIDSDAAHYLEGGTDALKNRYKIILGE